ncbi:hypothetical protein ACFWOJ_27030 [Streptomyces sp. NPDC058439]|uniref:hypothetical protein n=1 Tax=Streptomyces sp. NPDC058439 TaxID=3346500 RepID=UPI0036664A2F
MWFASRTTAEAHGMAEAAVANARIYGGAWEYAGALVFRTHMTVDMPGGMPGVDENARISVYEPGPGGGPAAGVRGLTSALRGARDARSAELVTGRPAAGVGTVLPKVGRHGEAVRILPAGDSRRLTARRLTGS